MRINVQILIALLLAPFIGLFIGYYNSSLYSDDYVASAQVNVGAFQPYMDMVNTDMSDISLIAADSISQTERSSILLSSIRENAKKEMEEYEQQKKQLDHLVEVSMTQSKASEGVLDQLLAGMLGDPIGQTFGKNATIKVYSLTEAGYRGYMAKVRIHNPDAIKMVLAEDQIASSGETTSHAAKRENAILGINAGGFASQNGKIRPLGITVIDGEIVTFSNADLSVIGFNDKGNLVGGKIESEQQIRDMGILHGASFLPTLLKDGVKQTIPKDWANARHPRTLIGHFQNGDLLFIVIDGRREGWSSGVTLEEAQNKLLEFKVRDAYNLDGGGSSTFYYNGKVLNRPSSGSERKVTTNIVIKP